MLPGPGPRVGATGAQSQDFSFEFVAPRRSRCHWRPLSQASRFTCYHSSAFFNGRPVTLFHIDIVGPRLYSTAEAIRV